MGKELRHFTKGKHKWIILEKSQNLPVIKEVLVKIMKYYFSYQTSKNLKLFSYGKEWAFLCIVGINVYLQKANL